MAEVHRAAPLGITALISGSGIGGLCTALELWRKGVDVRIFERTEKNITTGHLFMIGPSALRLLDSWPRMEAYHDRIAYHPLLVKCSQEGKPMGPPIPMTKVMDMHKTEATAKLHAPAHHSRPKFHEMLLDQLLAIDITVEYGREVVEYHEDLARGKGGVTLKDGTSIEADIVVAADGLRGASSKLVTGHPVSAVSSGSAIYRCSYPVELAMKDPLVAERFALADGQTSNFELWVGQGMFATFWRNDDHMMWSITHNDESNNAEESWANKISPADVLEFTSKIPGWPEVADRVIKATPADSLVNWKLMWRDPQPRWTSPGGFVVQLGDAAHTFLPSSGNGATQALEDGMSLAACVAQAGAGRIPDATSVHNLLRFERVSFLQAIGIARRDARSNAKARSKPKEAPEPGSWLYEHDAEKYAEQNYAAALDHVKNNTPFRNTNRPLKVEYQPCTIDSLMKASETGEPTILDGDWS